MYADSVDRGTSIHANTTTAVAALLSALLDFVEVKTIAPKN
jgi:hypothetical protein